MDKGKKCVYNQIRNKQFSYFFQYSMLFIVFCLLSIAVHSLFLFYPILLYDKRSVVHIVILFVFLLTAVYSDWRFGKIYNWQVLLGGLAGICFRYYESGPPGALEGMFAALIPLFLVFPLFRIGTFGGGDIKLLAAAATFFTFSRTFLFLGAAFLIGALEALIKMIKERNFFERFRYLMSYVHDIFTTNKWKLYEEAEKQPMEEIKKHKIHFAFPVFVSALLHMGGLY